MTEVVERPLEGAGQLLGLPGRTLVDLVGSKRRSRQHLVAAMASPQDRRTRGRVLPPPFRGSPRGGPGGRGRDSPYGVGRGRDVGLSVYEVVEEEDPLAKDAWMLRKFADPQDGVINPVHLLSFAGAVERMASEKPSELAVAIAGPGTRHRERLRELLELQSLVGRLPRDWSDHVEVRRPLTG